MGRPGFLPACAMVAPSLERQCISDSASSCHRLSYHQSVVDRASSLVSLSTVRLPDAHRWLTGTVVLSGLCYLAQRTALLSDRKRPYVFGCPMTF